MQQKILCLIKTTQYELNHKNKSWDFLSKERKKCLEIEQKHHTEFIKSLKNIVSKLNLNVTFTKNFNKISKKYGLIMTIGGDGTFLDAAQKSTGPLLGLNSNYHPNPKLGSIGALTSINCTNLEKRLIKLKQGKFKFEKLPKLSLKINDKEIKKTALNEIFIGNLSPYKSSDLEIIYNKKEERFNCSGVLISTSIGSFAWHKNAHGNTFSADKFSFLVREPNKDRKPKFTQGILNKNQKIIVSPNTNNHIISFDSKDDIIKLKATDIIEVKPDNKNVLKVVRF